MNDCIEALIGTIEGRYAVISPGSRNAPVIHALHGMGKTCYSVIDERSAGFIALGIARATGEPVILSCTSGTAAVNYYPAIAEAFYARIPLIVITADRPPELIDTWDGQAIRQNKIFDAHVRVSIETPTTYADRGAFEQIARDVNTYWKNGIPGPIHINVPIREPFYDLRPLEVNATASVRVHQTLRSITLPELAKHTGIAFGQKKVLLFNGMDDTENIVVANGNDGVMLSDLVSNQTSDVYYWDAMLFAALSKSGGINDLAYLAPDILVTTGTTTVSKGLKKFLQHFEPKFHIHLTRFDEVGAMFGTSPILVNPDDVEDIEDVDDDVDGLRDGPYIEAWLNAGQEFEERFADLDWSAYNEFSAVNLILNHLPDDSEVHWANSMAVRYASFLVNCDITNNSMYSNRGTSGIDGCTSTALGHALMVDNDVVLVTGELAFMYDSNAFFNAHVPNNLKVIVLNNRRGGIFDMIAGPEHLADARYLQSTPHDRDLAFLAKHHGIEYLKAENMLELENAVKTLFSSDHCSILEVVTDHSANEAFFALFKQL